MTVALSASLLLFLGGVGLLGYHIVEWLQSGVWFTYSTLKPLVWLGSTKAAIWTVSPESWLGLHQMLGWLPLWASMWIVAFLLLMVAAMVAD